MLSYSCKVTQLNPVSVEVKLKRQLHVVEMKRSAGNHMFAYKLPNSTGELYLGGSEAMPSI